MTNKKSILALIALCLAAVLLVSCDAPGVKLLDELLPPLTEKTTGYTVTQSIVVTRMATADSVEFTTPAEMETFHQYLEGIKCIREKERSDELFRYSITFFTADSAETLYVVSDKVFVYDGYHYDAMRGGIDTVYLENLFPAMEEPSADAEP